jgi:hypothetical protein
LPIRINFGRLYEKLDDRIIVIRRGCCGRDERGFFANVVVYEVGGAAIKVNIFILKTNALCYIE